MVIYSNRQNYSHVYLTSAFFYKAQKDSKFSIPNDGSNLTELICPHFF
jgi:hypothetical protein